MEKALMGTMFFQHGTVAIIDSIKTHTIPTITTKSITFSIGSF